ncbi:uncharacterized protein C2orf50-like isoform X2 [Lingula anatina]|uniref:Uncharacterized protein C2orf50-like isoform X2 n=1 Tax=Lingula anatina TaxID=7574 RepID=A0A1S3HQB0_LINAN|nr:uncharacterized protein C2orf50-like isoform X2 [Lingula anatina]|eukprot:XP_013387726.1 uncharacterized protein C2orf50-like isoform X2 [Lingula anatina]
MHRETSGVMFSYLNKTKPSAYHDRCIPTDSKVQTNFAEPSKAYSNADYEKCDQVTQDTIWKQSVAKETTGAKQWSENWGFLTEFDPKGNPKEKEPLPETATRFSDNVPNTNSGNYGSRLNTDLGKRMQNLEFQFYAEGRKKKLDGDIICY